MDIDKTVRERYSEAAKSRLAELCCAVDYNKRYLDAIPREIIERDYGCGDPSRFLREGETVLDLGSGGGKICYIAAQVVGASGRVIGVDMNDEMLCLARSYLEQVGDRLGFHNVAFHKARIQDLALDCEKLEQRLAADPVRAVEQLDALESWKDEQRRRDPLIADGSIDVVVSNCVLNLVRKSDRRRLFGEIHRVLSRGGRAVISDIVSDESVPEELMRDGRLWSGCVSGAFREDELLGAFEEAGFYGIRILERDHDPWQVIQGIEFRSLTVEAFKGKRGPCLERKQAVIYNGPWRSVTDDDGHTLHRGRRTAVCDKTFGIYTREPYAGQVIPVEPREAVPLEQAQPFDCSRDTLRHPRETKGQGYGLTRPGDAACCAPGGDGC